MIEHLGIDLDFVLTSLLKIDIEKFRSVKE